ncbi:MAG TPA: hypothetical protein VN372_04555 [Methanospirillum sp.]|nr:hypothetical protein [Methanospirillum sp.]
MTPGKRTWIVTISCLFLLLVLLSLTSGCTSTDKTDRSVMPEPTATLTHIVPDTPSIATTSPTSEPETQIPVTQPPTPDRITPQETEPVPSGTPFIPPAIATPGPLVIYRDQVLAMMAELQTAKEGLLLSYQANDITKTEEKAADLEKMIRRNAYLTDTPTKMDYIKVNWNEYIRQLTSCVQSFKDGSARWKVNDKASATSLFDAGLIAADRADIAVKHIRIFFDDHVPDVQLNSTLV